MIQIPSNSVLIPPHLHTAYHILRHSFVYFLWIWQFEVAHDLLELQGRDGLVETWIEGNLYIIENHHHQQQQQHYHDNIVPNVGIKHK